MRKFASVAVAAAIGLGAAVSTAGSANAQFLPPGPGFGPPPGPAPSAPGNGNWGAGLAAGAVLGLTLGAIANPYRGPAYYYPEYPEYGLPAAHVDWCYRRWRSYNAQTNTYMGYDGYPHVCVSPYY